jgi:penicillin amidase
LTRARRAAGGLVLVLGVVLAAGLLAWESLRGSLPRLDGDARVTGLQAPVEVDRDALGVPTVRGETRLDVARATGFLHAQDRFFQMDLMRRKAAGELAELVGPATVTLDRRIRVHRFRNVARRALEGATPEGRALLEAYASGVNAGLDALSVRPFEYLLLRSRPAPWKAEDAILVQLSMFIELQDEEGQLESTLGVMRDTLTPALFDFLVPLGTTWDAPLVGDAVAQPPVPGPGVVDLRKQAPDPSPAPGSRASAAEPLPAGSNSWAVAGKLTRSGSALLANDMHLGLAMPGTWYRMSLQWPGHRITGVTLPGTPLVVVGSTGRVAWGFTNSEGDWVDLVELELDPRDPEVYATPQGPKRIEHVPEVIHVRGAADQTLDVATTVWGPVIDRDHRGRSRALRWVAHEPRALNLGLLQLEDAQGLDDALRIAATTGIPAQNFVCADASGRIGWTIIGAIPRRVGYDGRTPTSWADGTRRWDGWLSPEEYPRVVDPPGGRLWTANARTVEGAELAKIGYGGYDLGARARQIRDDLNSLSWMSETDLLRVQLDDRAVFLAPWREILASTLRPLGARPSGTGRAWAKKQAEIWRGWASVDSVSYRLVRAFRRAVMDEALSPFFGACARADSRFDPELLHQLEGPVARLLTERPAHLLNPRYRSWNELIVAGVDRAVASLQASGPDLDRRTWGERNTVRVRHPLSPVLPPLSSFLDMPPEALPGDSNMPRFQGPAAGASERLVVSPGHEDKGIFHMPGGQSGHPLSPFYRAGHRAWARGEVTPFLPGPAVHRLRLLPPDGKP